MSGVGGVWRVGAVDPVLLPVVELVVDPDDVVPAADVPELALVVPVVPDEALPAEPVPPLPPLWARAVTIKALLQRAVLMSKDFVFMAVMKEGLMNDSCASSAAG